MCDSGSGLGLPRLAVARTPCTAQIPWQDLPPHGQPFRYFSVDARLNNHRHGDVADELRHDAGGARGIPESQWHLDAELFRVQVRFQRNGTRGCDETPTCASRNVAEPSRLGAWQPWMALLVLQAGPTRGTERDWLTTRLGLLRRCGGRGDGSSVTNGAEEKERENEGWGLRGARPRWAQICQKRGGLIDEPLSTTRPGNRQEPSLAHRY